MTLTSKLVNSGKRAIISIKENPKQAIKYTAKIKILDFVLTGMILFYGLPQHQNTNYPPQKNNIYYPVIRNDSKEDLENFLEKTYSPKEE